MKVAKPILAALLLIGSASAMLWAEPPVETSPATAPATGPEQEFLRFVPDGSDAGQLQTAIVSYRNDKGVEVDLAGAVHVGEKQYYAALNDVFAHYDALLYEMVKPRGMAAPRPGQRSGSAIGMFQHWLKDALDLDFQLDDVDYTKPNFVHADLDWESFQKLQGERGESILGIMLQSMLHEWAREQADPQGAAKQDITLIDLLVAFQSPDRPREFKLLLARQFSNIEEQMSGLTGPHGSVILTERNKQALSVLQQQIDAGKKHLAIFYGAAHMVDMQKKLTAMGFKPTGEVKWLTAWNMARVAAPTTHPATEKVRDGDVEDAAPAK